LSGPRKQGTGFCHHFQKNAMPDTQNTEDANSRNTFNARPCAAPDATEEEVRVFDVTGLLANEPNRCGASRGLAWWKNAWQMFLDAPGTWIGIGVVVIITIVSCSFLPVVGNFLLILIAGGLMLGCHALHTGEDLRFDHILAGFHHHLGPLLAVAAAWIAYTLVAAILIVAVISMVDNLVMANDLVMANWARIRDKFAHPLLLVSVFILFLSICLLPISMATWFAPALIVLHDMPAIKAMKLSFRGTLRNMLPVTLYGLVLIGLSIWATLPPFLGWLVLIPMLICGTYAAYRDIFLDET
jgi:hypothetical protein